MLVTIAAGSEAWAWLLLDSGEVSPKGEVRKSAAVRGADRTSGDWWSVLGGAGAAGNERVTGDKFLMPAEVRSDC